MMALKPFYVSKYMYDWLMNNPKIKNDMFGEIPIAPAPKLPVFISKLHPFARFFRKL